MGGRAGEVVLPLLGGGRAPEVAASRSAVSGRPRADPRGSAGGTAPGADSGSRPEVVRGERLEGAGPLDRVGDAGRHGQPTVAEAAGAAGRRRVAARRACPAGGAARCRAATCVEVHPVDQRAAQVGVALLQEASGSGRRRRAAASVSASASASVAQPLGQPVGELRRGRRGSRRAGGRRPRRWSMAWRTARSSRVRQVSWLMPIVTCSETVSWARAACGVPVGRYMLRPGLEQHLARLVGLLAGRRVDLPQLGAVGLEDEDVVAVAVHREALRARAGSGRRWPGTGGRARARARRPAGSAAASSGAAPGARRSRRPRTGRSPCGRRPARSAAGRRGWRRCGCSATAASTEPSLASRTAGVRIAVDVSSSSTSSNESSPTRSAGSALCTWTWDAQTFSTKFWASPLSSSRASHSGRRSRHRRCRRVESPSVPSASPDPPSVPSASVESPSVPSPSLAVGAVRVAAVGAVGVAAGHGVGATRGGVQLVVAQGLVGSASSGASS